MLTTIINNKIINCNYLNKEIKKKLFIIVNCSEAKTKSSKKEFFGSFVYNFNTKIKYMHVYVFINLFNYSHSSVFIFQKV